jgi:hypothetical protein
MDIIFSSSKKQFFAPLEKIKSPIMVLFDIFLLFLMDAICS